MLASRRRRRRFVSYALMAVGMVLLFLGARDFFAARLGQTEAERAFEKVNLAKPSPFPRKARPKVALGEAIAKMIIPRLDVELYVVEGDGATELRRGPGHVAGTAMPGQDGNCIIAGHRDTHFRALKDIRTGDEIILQTRAGKYTYWVKNTQVVSPSDGASLKPTGDAELHLITCYPFYYLGSAPKRFVVQAQLREGGPSLDASASNLNPRHVNQFP
jgi:LPXTG-site transpeptidase (sortase) family protein